MKKNVNIFILLIFLILTGCGYSANPISASPSISEEIISQTNTSTKPSSSMSALNPKPTNQQKFLSMDVYEGFAYDKNNGFHPINILIDVELSTKIEKALTSKTEKTVNIYENIAVTPFGSETFISTGITLNYVPNASGPSMDIMINGNGEKIISSYDGANKGKEAIIFSDICNELISMVEEKVDGKLTLKQEISEIENVKLYAYQEGPLVSELSDNTKIMQLINLLNAADESRAIEKILGPYMILRKMDGSEIVVEFNINGYYYRIDGWLMYGNTKNGESIEKEIKQIFRLKTWPDATYNYLNLNMNDFEK